MECPSISLVKRLDTSSVSDITEQVERFWTISCRVSARGRGLHPSTAPATLQSTASALIAVTVMTLRSSRVKHSRHYCCNWMSVIFKSLGSSFLISAISSFFPTWFEMTTFDERGERKTDPPKTSCIIIIIIILHARLPEFDYIVLYCSLCSMTTTEYYITMIEQVKLSPSRGVHLL